MGPVACSETAVKPGARSLCEAALDIVESLVATDGPAVRSVGDDGCRIESADGTENYGGVAKLTAEELAGALSRVDMSETTAREGYVMMPMWPFEYVLEVGECRLMVIAWLDDSQPPTADGPNVMLVETLRDGLRIGTIRCSLDD